MTFLNKYYHWIPLLLLCSFFVFRAMDFPVHDFANYYFGGQFLAEGNFGKWVYFPYEFNKSISDLGHHGVFVSYAPNTPFLALLFAPLSWIPVAAAKIIFNAISCGLFFFSLKRIIAFYRINPAYLLAVPVLFFVPIKNELLFGQVYLLLFFLLAEGWLAYQKKQLGKMAIFLSLAIMLKVFPVFLLLIFLFKKQFRACAYAMISTSILFAISLPFTGLDIWFFYLKEVLPKATNGEIATAYVDNYQSFFMFLKRILVYDFEENPKVLLHFSALFSALIVVFKAALIAIGYYISKKSTDSLFVLAYWIFAIILMSPYGSTYSFVLLIFLLLAVSKNNWPISKKMAVLALLFLVNNFPLGLFLSQPFPISYLRLFFLLALFTILVFQSHDILNPKVISLCTAIPLLLIFIPEKRADSGTLVSNDFPILFYDYKIAGNKLTCFYWDENGAGQKTIRFNHHETQNLQLQDNQVFYNNRYLTFDKSNKLKPIIVDGNSVIYLSDAGRGIGFFTLRKINLE